MFGISHAFCTVYYCYVLDCFALDLKTGWSQSIHDDEDTIPHLTDDLCNYIHDATNLTYLNQ